MSLPSDETAIRALARQLRTAHEVVRHLYDEEIAVLEAQATVKNFIGIIASRRVKQRLIEANGNARLMRYLRRA